jgi:acetate kinase
MNVLSLNVGSSSLKYSVRRMPEEQMLCHGEARRVGARTAQAPEIVHHAGRKTTQIPLDSHGYDTAFAKILETLDQADASHPDVVSHRIVHGGTMFHESAIVGDQTIEQLESIQHLAPIHNPPAIAMLKVCRSQLPDLPQVCVFDTAFHATIPEYAATYPLPRDLAQELGLRKYGFHGISHQYVSSEAARILGKPLEKFNAVSCHLGTGGASLCAIRNGRSVDNTMGLTPLQGLVMSTRSGDLDPGLVLRLLHQSNGNHDQTESLLNKNSGVLGMTGKSADLRDLLKDVDGDELSLALRVYAWRLRKYLGAFMVVAEQPHAITFTDTIGETVPLVRQMCCDGLACFGVNIDPQRNRSATNLPVDIATPNSKVRVLVIHTDEELALARMAWQTVNTIAA